MRYTTTDRTSEQARTRDTYEAHDCYDYQPIFDETPLISERIRQITVTLTPDELQDVILALYGDANRHWSADRLATAKTLHRVIERIEAQAPGLFEPAEEDVA